MIKLFFCSASLLMQNKSRLNQRVSGWFFVRWQCVALVWQCVALGIDNSPKWKVKKLPPFEERWQQMF